MKVIINSILFFILVFLISNCSYQLDNTIEKPKNLIPQDTFTMALKEIMLVESFYSVQEGDKEGIKDILPEAMETIYQKYKIDSLRFAESMGYYARKQSLLRDIYKDIQDSLILETAGMEIE